MRARRGEEIDSARFLVPFVLMSKQTRRGTRGKKRRACSMLALLLPLRCCVLFLTSLHFTESDTSVHLSSLCKVKEGRERQMG